MPGQRVHGRQGRIEGFLDAAFRFLDIHVFGRDVAPDPEVTVQSGGPDGEWRTEATWPPADVATWTMDLNTGSYDDSPEDVTGGPGEYGIWSATPELPHAMHIAGEMELTVSANTVAPGTHLVVRVYDLDDTASGPMVQRGAVALPNAGENTVTFKLYPQDFLVQEGHRLAVNVMASDDGWYSPGATGTTVEITSAQLSIPLLTLQRGEGAYVDGDASDASVSFPVKADPAVIASAEVEGAIPPAMG